MDSINAVRTKTSMCMEEFILIENEYYSYDDESV